MTALLPMLELMKKNHHWATNSIVYRNYDIGNKGVAGKATGMLREAGRPKNMMLFWILNGHVFVMPRGRQKFRGLSGP